MVLIPGETDKLEIVNAISQEEAESVFKEIDNCIKEKGLQAAYQLGDELVLSKIYKLSGAAHEIAVEPPTRLGMLKGGG